MPTDDPHLLTVELSPVLEPAQACMAACSDCAAVFRGQRVRKRHSRNRDGPMLGSTRRTKGRARHVKCNKIFSPVSATPRGAARGARLRAPARKAELSRLSGWRTPRWRRAPRLTLLLTTPTRSRARFRRHTRTLESARHDATPQPLPSLAFLAAAVGTSTMAQVPKALGAALTCLEPWPLAHVRSQTIPDGSPLRSLHSRAPLALTRRPTPASPGRF